MDQLLDHLEEEIFGESAESNGVQRALNMTNPETRRTNLWHRLNHDWHEFGTGRAPLELPNNPLQLSVLTGADDEDPLEALVRQVTDKRPVYKYQKVEGVDEQCTVCFESYIQDDPVRQLKCKHVFHENCLTEWLKRKLTCPYCRFDLCTDHYRNQYLL